MGAAETTPPIHFDFCQKLTFFKLFNGLTRSINGINQLINGNTRLINCLARLIKPGQVPGAAARGGVGGWGVGGRVETGFGNRDLGTRHRIWELGPGFGN